MSETRETTNDSAELKFRIQFPPAESRELSVPERRTISEFRVMPSTAEDFQTGRRCATRPIRGGASEPTPPSLRARIAHNFPVGWKSGRQGKAPTVCEPQARFAHLSTDL